MKTVDPVKLDTFRLKQSARSAVAYIQVLTLKMVLAESATRPVEEPPHVPKPLPRDA